MTDPIRPTDDEARGLARGLLKAARIAALAVLHPENRAPYVARIGFGSDGDGQPVALVSDLSTHTRALRSDPRASLLIGEPGRKGDPLNQPRLTLQCRARFVAPGAAEQAQLARIWVEAHPKARLYVGFADFHFVRFGVEAGFLNGGFGKAFMLTAADLDLDA